MVAIYNAHCSRVVKLKLLLSGDKEMKNKLNNPEAGCTFTTHNTDQYHSRALKPHHCIISRASHMMKIIRKHGSYSRKR